MMRAVRGLAVLGAVVFSLAHVGSPDTFFQGAAGPYPIRVVIRTPGIVPGLADISVRLLDGRSVRAVTVLPLRGGIPTAALPPADTARRVAGDSSLYSAQLWLMVPGSYSVQVKVDGAAGDGVALVPVMSVATRRLDMRRPVAIALLGLGAFLFVGALTIVGAAVRESDLPPGAEPDAARRRRAWFARGMAVLVLGLAVAGGRAWWNNVDGAFRRGMYRPMTATASVQSGAAGRTLRFVISDPGWRRRERTPLIPDHGKLMHLFVVGTNATNGFAHLHPAPLDSSTFDASLPPLPAGRYRVYADVVHESGLAETLSDSLDLEPPPTASWSPGDSDDAWDSGLGTRDSGAVRLQDGSTLAWLSDRAPAVNQDLELEFQVTGPDGKPATLQPYMGMASHAVIARDDGAVFIHLHPAGTIAMASQLTYTLRQPGDTVWGRLGARITAAERMGHAPEPTLSGRFSIPYAFPQPGRYRVWVQVKRAGRILTGRFDVTVAGFAR